MTRRPVTRVVLPLALLVVAAARPGATRGPTSTAEADELFGLATLHTVHLTIAADDFGRMLPPRPGDDAYVAVPATLELDGQTWGAISVRYKGNSSYRYAPSELKRSLKIDFDPSGAGRTAFDISELNLNNNAFDPSQMRETLAYDVFRRAGVVAPRTAFARVLITVPGKHARRYAGLFTVVEQVDQRFFRNRWGREVGVLMKPEGLAGMPYLGDDWTQYRDPYGAKVTPAGDDAARFVAFLKLLNQGSEAELARRIGDYLDVDQFLRFLACEVVLVNMDSPLAMNHNYWMTVHPVTHKVVFVPWDMNMAFAGFKPSDANLSLHAPSVPGSFPLAERLLSIKEIVVRYDRMVRDIMSSNVTVARIAGQIAAIEPAIGAAVAAERPAIVSNAPPLPRFVAERVQAVADQLAGRRAGIPAQAPASRLRASKR